MCIAEKLVTIAENELKVFDAGKKAEYDAFWDSVQENGNRKNYDFGFAGEAWSADNFKPKHPIQPTSCQNMFAYWGTYSGRRGTVDLRGFSIDFSKSTLVANCFYGNFFVVAMGEINTTSVIHLQNFFSTCPNLHTIEKLIVKESGETTYYNTFYYCINLKNITFEGVIGNDISFQDSPLLTHDSLMSIINHLKDFSGTTTTRALSLGTTNLAKLTDAEKAIATQKGWTLS